MAQKAANGLIAIGFLFITVFILLSSL